MIAGPDPFLQLVPNRTATALRRLRELVWRDPVAVKVTAAGATAAHRSLAEAARGKRRSVVPATAWGRLYDQRWFHLELPRDRGAARYLEWRDQGEATLWIGAEPYYGFDVAHRRVALPAGVREAWVEGYCCQSAIWHADATGLSSRGSMFGGAYTWRRDDAVWDAAQDLQALFDLMMHLRAQQTPAPPRELARIGLQPGLDGATPLYRQLLRRLAEAVDAFDTAGLAGLRPRLRAARRAMRDGRARVRAVLTGHAHIDLVWLWPERMGEAKAVHTFATVNRLMTLYPEFRFAYSQPASYRAVERRAPALARAVGRRIRSGQWQATGAMDVESDTLLPCGEALARSLLLGQAEFRRLRGTPSRLLWLPDVFGYSGCLPQLMRLAGVDWFFTTKLTWSALNRFPHSSFVWRGVDGSEVLAHVTQNAGYNNRLDLAELDGNARGHVQADVHDEFLHPTGYGDGGGGPTEEMCERARRLGSLGGTPALAWDQPEAFFARLARRRAALPLHQGECYLEYHRGTFTTHGELKAAFRGLERALQVREAAAVAAGRAPDLTAAWRRLVFAQFHDYIPGSSVDDVYAEGVPELRRLARAQVAAARRDLSGAGGWHAFNPLPQRWQGWVRPPGGRPAVWMEVPPLASAKLAAPAPEPPPAAARGPVLRNGRLEAELGPDGWLRRLAVAGRELALAGPVRAFLYPDRPANYDAWDIDRHTLQLGEPVRSRARVILESAGPRRAAIAVTRALGRRSRLTLRYILEAGAAVLRIEAEVDWREPETLLKLHFPTAYRGLHARYGAPFGSTLRGQQPGSAAADAQWEVPGSRWAVVAADGEREGLAVITEAKYGFSARDGELTVSLLRGARITGCDDHRYAAPPGLNRHRPASPFSDQGRHLIRLAVGGYDACGVAELHPAALADSLFTPPLVFRGPPRHAGFLGLAGAPTLVAAWAMPLEAGSWLLRLHEVSGQRGVASLALAAGWRARRCGLDGAPQGGPLRNGKLPFRPYEIVSVRVERQENP
ncbi:MAG TPA: glycoside hydrolase family 38 C-terminal domain-containing protein [Opitutaceae bacterium]|nr:glycoside hydrolase family 38 C-terminal domain-containing protein [Opitutaceae bacterium]